MADRNEPEPLTPEGFSEMFGGGREMAYAEIDAIMLSLNDAAAAVGAPWAVRKTIREGQVGYELHPDLYRLLKENPDLLR